MAVVVHDEGEVLALKYLTNKTSSADLKLRLFSNNLTPADTDVLSAFTEVSGGGYAAQTLTGSAWTVSSVGGVANAIRDVVTFTCSGAVTAYGLYITDGAGTTVLASERFTGAPFVLPSGGGAINVTPTLTEDVCS